MNSLSRSPKHPDFLGRLLPEPVTQIAESVRAPTALAKEAVGSGGAIGLRAPKATVRALLAGIDRTPTTCFRDFCAQSGVANDQIAQKEAALWLAQAALFVLVVGFATYAGYMLFHGEVFSAALTAILGAGCWIRALRFGWLRVMFREKQMLSLRAAIAKGAAWPI